MKKNKVDVLVIGSGVGGLCTAARLAEKGLKVVVAEKLPYLGGRFSTREYKGFKITTGAIMVPHGDESTFQEAFDLVDAPMNIRDSSGVFRFRLDHGEHDLSTEGAGLYELLEFATKDEKTASELGVEFMRGLTSWEPLNSITFREWLSQYTNNSEVHGIFQGFCGAFIGVNSNEAPVDEYFNLLRSMGFGVKYGISINGNIEIMESLAAGIKNMGGEVYTNAVCKRIIVENRGVTGAVIEKDGAEEIIEAEYVVSNMGPGMTVKLTGESHFEKSYMTRLREHQFVTPVVHICIGSREPLADFDGIINFGNTRRLVFFETPTITCPELAPEGMHMSTTYSVPQYASAPLKLRETVEMAMLDIQENFPSFRESDVLIVGTHHDEWPSMRRWPGYPMPFKTPVDNLYNVGDGCMPRGMVGIEACAVSAKRVADEILKWV